jgi:predicted GIY-YIG superfamily endonuclease
MDRDEMRRLARENVKTWPPLTDWQKDRLRVLLRPDLPEPDSTPQGADVTPDEMWAAAREEVKSWPPLSEAQKIRLRVLLRPDLPKPADDGLIPPPPAAVFGAPAKRQPTRPRSAPPPEVPTALYRRYDADDVLLYIGISENPDERANSHLNNSAWTHFAVREEREMFPNRPEALTAETAAIEAERPVFNLARADASARERSVQYLIDKGRLDLLAPVPVGRRQTGRW